MINKCITTRPFFCKRNLENIYYIKFVYDYLFSFQLIVSANLIHGQEGSTEEHQYPYEPTENACDRCNCTEKIADQKSDFRYFQLNCAAKGLKQVLNKFPDFFDNKIGNY